MQLTVKRINSKGCLCCLRKVFVRPLLRNTLPGKVMRQTSGLSRTALPTQSNVVFLRICFRIILPRPPTSPEKKGKKKKQPAEYIIVTIYSTQNDWRGHFKQTKI